MRAFPLRLPTKSGQFEMQGTGPPVSLQSAAEDTQALHVTALVTRSKTDPPKVPAGSAATVADAMTAAEADTLIKQQTDIQRQKTKCQSC